MYERVLFPAIHKKKAGSKKKVQSKVARGANPARKKLPLEAAVERRTPRNWEIAGVALLLSLMLVQMVWMARTKSSTMDEQNHITRGIAYLRTGDLRMGYVHPPLINLISALPLLFDSSIVLPLDGAAWQGRDLTAFGNEFLWKANPDGHSIVFRARLPIIALTLLLGMIIYAWGRELYGQKAGLLALTLFAFAPNVLAHGSLATNDMGVACFSTLSLYTFWRWLRKPAWDRAVVASVAFGLAQASKFSAVFLIPALALVAIAYWLLTPFEEGRARRMIRGMAWLVLILIVGAITLWAVYAFKLSPSSGTGHAMPASDYFSELRFLATRVEKGNPTFLLGSYSTEGWWFYFPVAFAVKTPLATLLLIAASLIYSWRKRAWREGLLLLIPVIVYFGLSMTSSLNIGYRHLLPALAPLLVFAGQLGQIRWQRKSAPAWGVAIMLIWLAIATLSVFPHDLAYFNEIAGGPQNGYKVLVDSNLDWGQDLIGLRKYMQGEGIESVKLGYFGSADPHAYGINYDPLPGYPQYMWPYDAAFPGLTDPKPGVYAISATNLQGPLFLNHKLYAWFRERKPDVVIGYSIFVYKVK